MVSKIQFSKKSKQMNETKQWTRTSGRLGGSYLDICTNIKMKKKEKKNNNGIEWSVSVWMLV